MKSKNNKNQLEKSDNSIPNIDNESDTYRSEPIYKHLCFRFFKLFSDHNYTPEDKFDKNVWFLKNNSNFQNLILYDRTPDSNNSEVIRIINDNSYNGPNLRNLLVDVRKFVNEISKSLFEANSRLVNANDMVKHYKMDEMKEIILSRMNKEKSVQDLFGSITELKFSLTNLENFPEGSYDIKLFYEAYRNDNLNLYDENYNSDSLKDKYYVKLFGNKKINIYSTGEKKFVPPENFEVIYLKLEKVFENLDLNSISLNKSKFSIDTSYTGITINSFRFSIEKDGIVFAVSDNELIIDNFINSLDLLLKDKPFKCNFSTFANLNKNNKHLKKYNDDKQFLVFYDLEINFDKKTKILVLEKIFNMFQETIVTKYDNEKVIQNITSYFHEISKDIENVFNEKKSVNADNCSCNNCLIF